MQGAADFANCPPLAGRLISAGLASMADLKTVLTLEDAYRLDEVLTLKNYHAWLSAKEVMKRGANNV